MFQAQAFKKPTLALGENGSLCRYEQTVSVSPMVLITRRDGDNGDYSRIFGPDGKPVVSEYTQLEIDLMDLDQRREALREEMARILEDTSL